MAFLSSFYPQPVVSGTTEGTFAEGNHGHELDELEATAIPVGKVLTATGSNTASWQDPAATGDVEEAPEDGIIYGRKDADWVDITEPANLQIRRGTAAEVNAITPLEGEPVWETDAKKLVVGDGATVGGVEISNFPLEGIKAASAGNSGSVYVTDSVEARGGAGPNLPAIAGSSRGAGAIDLQARRSVATQVASGVRSVLIGGFNNTASSTGSIVIGGQSSTTSGVGSLNISSISSTNQGNNSCLILGNSNTIGSSGDRSFAINSNATIGPCFVANNAYGDRKWIAAFGNGDSPAGFGGSQRVQNIQITLRERTTDSTPKTSQLIQFSIPSDIACFGIAEICAFQESGNNYAFFVRKFSIANRGGSTSLLGSITTIGTDHKSESEYDVLITADDSIDSLVFTVTGKNSVNLRWAITIRGTEFSII